MAAFTVIYLHGLASSPASGKALYLQQQFGQLGIPVEIPDLNQGDFTHLTLTRQIHQVRRLLSATPTVLIGSSLGGLTAAFLVEDHPQISHLVLLAPAFGMLTYWRQRTSAEQLQQWQQQGTIPVYHYGEGKELPLHYEFLLDLERYDETRLRRPVPTLILHGQHDEVIPLSASETYAQSRPWVRLVPVADDHSLKRDLPLIWQEIVAFLGLSPGP
ncbi:YqiA/YcfP family alpha/beta fold hydrolase [Gloeomargarita sp.]